MPDYDDEKLACFMLSVTGGIGSKTICSMKTYAGSYGACLDIPPGRFLSEGIISKKQEASLKEMHKNRGKLKNEFEAFAGSGINMLCLDETSYPRRLKNIDLPPHMLFVRGKLPEDEKPAAAIIGARQCSDYGASATRFFAAELAKKGVQIVSGLAFGIDSAAAAGALKAGFPSYAVLGSGVNICYPMENYRLYEQMSGTGGSKCACGGVISEQHPQAMPFPKNFIMRNRIIAGLCDVLLVMEARDKSGTSITVDHALQQGKEVFALPGRITDPLGRGCNRLLRDGAAPLTEPGDVLMALGIEEEAGKVFGKLDAKDLSGQERKVYKVMGADPQHIENIAAMAGVDIKEAICIINALELKGYAVSSGRAYFKAVYNS